MDEPVNGTLLVITPMSGRVTPALTPYAARGLTQTLEQIDAPAPSILRDINGTLVDISPPQFEKYKSSITCKDRETPMLDGVWRGQVVTVDCVGELSSPTGTPKARTMVAGSERIDTDSHTTYYRPQLVMRIMNIRPGKDEYGADCNWQADLEEV